MDLKLRLLAENDALALQRLYEAAPSSFTRLLGRPAPAGLAARDIAQAHETPGRYQFGAELDGELIGMVDCKLADEVPGQAHIGLLLLADHHADAALATLLLRIVARWLAGSYGVHRLTCSAPAHEPAELAFWQTQGFAFTGEQYRRELEGFQPRFLMLARDLPLAQEEAGAN